MTKEQRLICDLSYALGLAIGSLETIKICPYDFNQDGLEKTIERLKEFSNKIYESIETLDNGR